MERRSVIVTVGVAALLALPLACRTQPRAEEETSRRAAIGELQAAGAAALPRPPAAVEVNETHENTSNSRYCCAACAGSNVMPWLASVWR